MPKGKKDIIKTAAENQGNRLMALSMKLLMKRLAETEKKNSDNTI